MCVYPHTRSPNCIHIHTHVPHTYTGALPASLYRIRTYNDFLFRIRASTSLHGAESKLYVDNYNGEKMSENCRGFLFSEAPRILEDVQSETSARTLESLDPAVHGRFGFPRVQKSSLNPAVSRDSRILRFFRYFIYFSFFSPLPFGLSDLKIRGSSDTRSSGLGNSLDLVRILGSHVGAKGKWLLNQESLTDRAGRRSDRGPSNSLRFREAAARFGSLISFRI